MSLLTVTNLHSGYGKIEALHGLSLEVKEKEIVTLVGANGAGKTTLLMTISGKPQPWSGDITFAGQSIAGRPMHEIAHLKLAHVPEGRRIFPHLTVFENLQVGATLADPERFDKDLQYVYALFPRLKERQGQRGGTLSGGEQQMLAIGRALMGEPKLLLLDEPSLGLAPLIVQQIFEVLAEINQSWSLPILLVEQNAHHALRLAHRGYVLVNGKIALSGTGEDLLAMPEVRAAYLEGA